MKPLLVLAVYHPGPGMYYGVMEKLTHALVRLGHNVVTVDDRGYARAATIFGSRKFGIVHLNRHLLKVAQGLCPDMMLLGHCDMVWNSTLEAVRAAHPAVRMAYCNVDALFYDNNNEKMARRAEAVDAIFNTTSGDRLATFAGKRARLSYIPNPFDRAIERQRAFEETDFLCDLFYGIRGEFKGDTRAGVVQRLMAACPDTRIRVQGMMGQPYLTGAAYLNALKTARMGLNYSRINDVPLYSSDRMTQYMGNGLMVFQDRASGFGQLFAEQDMAFYGSFDELIDKIRYYTANDAACRAVARSGWERGHGAFSSDRVAQYILDVTFERPHSNTYEWPTTLY